LEENVAEENGISNRQFSSTFIPPLTLRVQGSNLRQAELEQIGEFFAVAIVRDIQEAFFSNPERASLMIDLLPRELWAQAEMNPDRFDAWYFDVTGKQRLRRH
jgi:hypothetical protein